MYGVKMLKNSLLVRVKPIHKNNVMKKEKETQVAFILMMSQTMGSATHVDL